MMRRDDQLTVCEWMTKQFIFLDESIAVTQALSTLQKATPSAGIIVNSDGKAQRLIIPADLERASTHAGAGDADLTLAKVLGLLPPLIEVKWNAILAEVLTDKQTRTFLIHGARGLVVKKDDQTMGVLLYHHAPSSHRLLQTSYFIQLPDNVGVTVHPIVCKRCGTPNTLAFLDPENLPQCVNKRLPEPGPHQLELGWQ